MMKILAVAITLLLTCSISAAYAEEIGSWKQIIFKSNPAVNFHHFVFEMARTREEIDKQGWERPLSREEVRQLENIVSYYKNRYINLGRSPMRTSPLLRSISRELTKYEEGQPYTLPDGEHQKLFEQAFPIYKTLLWQKHDAYNKEWLSKLVQLLNRYGDTVQEKLEKVFEHPLLSKAGHPVDIVYRPGHRNGAFTQAEPYTMINSFQKSYGDLASLEMIFHEVAHAVATNPLENHVSTIFTKYGIADWSGISHPIQFYIVGKTVEDVLLQNDVQYIQYARQQGLYSRGFSRYFPYIEMYWAPHMATEESMVVPIENMAKEIRAELNKPKTSD